jgi:hypothetical protein
MCRTQPKSTHPPRFLFLIYFLAFPGASQQVEFKSTKSTCVEKKPQKPPKKAPRTTRPVDSVSVSALAYLGNLGNLVASRQPFGGGKKRH